VIPERAPLTASTAPESPFQLRIAVMCIMAGAFTQALDQTIANVALPHMQGSLQADRAEINWVLTSYIVAAAIMTPPTSWLAARFGEKNVLLFSLIGFTLTSALCGAAQTLPQMVLFRILQGCLGAPLVVVSQSIVIAKYPAEQRATVMSWWGTAFVLAPIVGPTLGGWLTDSYSWRWVFYVNVPIGFLSALGIIVCLKDVQISTPKRFDAFGFSMLGLALGGFQLMLDRGADQDWFQSSEIVLEAAICGVGLYLFIVHLATVGSMLFPRGLFRDRNFISGITLTFVTSGLVITSTALLPPYLQTLGGRSVVDVGLLLAPRGIGTLVSIQIVQWTVKNVDPRIFIFVGSSIAVSTFWLMAHWTPDVSTFTIGATAIIQGFGLGFVFIPTGILSFATLNAEYRTDGSAIQMLARSMGGAIGVSLTSMVISTYNAVVHANIVEKVSPFNRPLFLNATGMMWNPQLPMGARALEAIASHNAAVVAYSDAFLLMFFLGLLAPVVALMMQKPTGIVKIEPLPE